MSDGVNESTFKQCNDMNGRGNDRGGSEEEWKHNV